MGERHSRLIDISLAIALARPQSALTRLPAFPSPKKSNRVIAITGRGRPPCLPGKLQRIVRFPTPKGLDAGDPNFYRYVKNDPVNDNDPSGLQVVGHIFAWYDKQYADTGLFGTFIGVTKGDQITRDFGGVDFTVSGFVLTSFVNKYWDVPPPGYRRPIKEWVESEWDSWFVMNGKRRSVNITPNPENQKAPPKFKSSDLQTITWKDCTDEKLKVMTFDQKLRLAIELATEKGMFPEELNAEFRELIKPKNIAVMMAFMAILQTIVSFATITAVGGAASGPPGWVVDAILLVILAGIGANVAADLYEMKLAIDSIKRCGEMTDGARAAAKGITGLGINTIFLLLTLAGWKRSKDPKPKTEECLPRTEPEPVEPRVEPEPVAPEPIQPEPINPEACPQPGGTQTAPSNTPAPSLGKGKLTIDPIGTYTTSDRAAAQYMADLGHDVTLRPPTGTRAGGGTSDLLVDGVRYDVYTPKTTNPDRIIGGIAKKNSQAEGVVLDLTNTCVTQAQLGDVLKRVHGAGATNIKAIVIIGGN